MAQPVNSSSRNTNNRDNAALWLTILIIFWLIPLITLVVMLFVNGTIKL